MKKYLIFFFILFFNLSAQSSTNQEIINHLEKINSLEFKFIQKIDNNNIEKGECIILYPKKILCKYYDIYNKILVSNGKSLIINSDKIKIVDLCAAPGGKTIQLLKANKKVTSVDVSNERIKILEQNLRRLNLKENIVVDDGRKWRPKEKIDAVLLDAPCSATGTIRKHPDIVKNRSKVNLDKYISLQIDLIKQSLTWLDKGGILIYAVCSLQKKEGEEQIKSILQTEVSVEILPIKPSEVLAFSQAITKEGWLRIFPNFLSPFGGNDGFFICRLQKK